MNKLKTIVTIVLLSVMTPAFSGGVPSQNIPILGQWNPDNPSHFMASTPLEPGDTYTIKNNTQETITVWLLDDRDPTSYFPLLAGGTQEFTSPGDSFDIYAGGSIQIKNVVLKRVSGNEAE